MSVSFFERPILNSPYEYPFAHWQLDEVGRPTQHIIRARRKAEFITPVPGPTRRGRTTDQADMILDDGEGLSTSAQAYNPMPIINELRSEVDTWRALPSERDWLVTPETARLLKHWRHYL